MEKENKSKTIQMMRLGFPTTDGRLLYEKTKVETNKTISRLISKARSNAKNGTCWICGKECTSFCNSHSIPRFVLNRVSDTGIVLAPLQEEIPTLGKSLGINKAGTFHLICNECDNTLFQDYENPSSYINRPTDKVLAQIALKNCLQMISKRNEEQELYKILGQEYENGKSIVEEKLSIAEMDLNEYVSSFRYAYKTIQSSNTKNKYYLCYYRVLDYVVPYATQSGIAIVSDFEDATINNIFCDSSDYKIKSIHCTILPLKKTSVVMLFVENGEKRYRKFYKQLNKLTPEDQLAAINYIVFSYTENVFMHPNTALAMQNNPEFMDACRKSTDIISGLPLLLKDPLTIAIDDFSLSNRNRIPNLLCRDYALEPD